MLLYYKKHLCSLCVKSVSGQIYCAKPVYASKVEVNGFLPIRFLVCQVLFDPAGI